MAAFEIVVVDSKPKRFPPPKALLKMGVPLDVAAAWERLRKRMNRSGLRRWAREHRN